MDPNEKPVNPGEQSPVEDKSNLLVETLYEAAISEETQSDPEQSIQITGTLGDVVERLKQTPAEEPKPGDQVEPEEGTKPTDEAKPGDQVKPALKVEKPEPEGLPKFEVKPAEPAPGADIDLDDPAWTDEQRDRLELALFAERSGDKKYEGLAKKYADYFKAHDKFVKDAQDEDPDVEFDENNAEYQKFLREHRPELSTREIRTLERGLIIDAAKKEVGKEYQAKLEEQERQLKQIRTEPEARKLVDEFNTKLKDGIYPEDLAKLIKEKGEDAAKQEYAFEMAVYGEEVQAATQRVEDFVKLSKGLQPYSDSNANHKWLVDFIDREGLDFYQRGGAHRVKDGKTFLPRANYHEAVRAGQGDKYWTFADSDIINLLEVKAVRDAQTRVKKEVERLEKLGFKRSVVKPAAPAATKPVEEPSPKATVSTTPAPEGEPASPGAGNSIFGVLGY